MQNRKISLADARKARDQAKILLDDGINPSQNRKQEKIEAQYLSVSTFKLVANEYIVEILGSR